MALLEAHGLNGLDVHNEGCRLSREVQTTDILLSNMLSMGWWGAKPRSTGEGNPDIMLQLQDVVAGSLGHW